MSIFKPLAQVQLEPQSTRRKEWYQPVGWEEARPTKDMVESCTKCCLPVSLRLSVASLLQELSAYLSKALCLCLLSLPLHSHQCTFWAFRLSPFVVTVKTCLSPAFSHPPALVLAVASSWRVFSLPPTGSSRYHLIHLSMWPCAKDRACFWLGLGRQFGEDKQMGGWKDRRTVLPRVLGPRGTICRTSLLVRRWSGNNVLVSALG